MGYIMGMRLGGGYKSVKLTFVLPVSVILYSCQNVDKIYYSIEKQVWAYYFDY